MSELGAIESALLSFGFHFARRSPFRPSSVLGGGLRYSLYLQETYDFSARSGIGPSSRNFSPHGRYNRSELLLQVVF